MKHLLEKYADKMVAAGLAADGEPLIGGIDADLLWNRPDPRTAELEKVFAGLNINSLLFSKPAEPYSHIIDYLTSQDADAIFPMDCETRTFLHDLPVIHEFDAGLIIDRLKQRKSVIVAGDGIVTWGTVSPEQAFIFFSSVCFACFVKFFSDYLVAYREETVSPAFQAVFDDVITQLDEIPDELPQLIAGPFKSENMVYQAISEAGRLTVDYRLVDSFFGNVSYIRNGILYISQTGSSLDELEGCIDPCPLDGSSCTSITASSEFIAHRDALALCGKTGILHGHPKFSVIMSMDCRDENCEFKGRCHSKCPKTRYIDDIPVVSGEVGTGPTGLCNTLPRAMQGNRGVIVYGHGLFTVAENDFNKAFATLLDVERMCRDRYFREVGIFA